MTYGRQSRRGNTKGAKQASNNSRVKIDGRHDLEQLSFALQKMIALLQEQHVHSVQFCSVYFTPLDRQGERKHLFDEKGRPVEMIEIEAGEFTGR